MATQLWKDGKSQWFPARRVALLLKSGWAVTNEPVKKEKAPDKPVKKEKAPDFMLDEDEIREKAKKAGIKNHWNKSIETLLEELKD